MDNPVERLKKLYAAHPPCPAHHSFCCGWYDNGGEEALEEAFIAIPALLEVAERLIQLRDALMRLK